jgi:hypothetical protein
MLLLLLLLYFAFAFARLLFLSTPPDLFLFHS